jgi:hypothetical protein
MRAHELLSDPATFTRDALARDRRGRSCGTLPEGLPVSFDALGAIFWCYPNGKHAIEDPHTGTTPCQRARELAQSKYGRSLGRLDYQEALDVLRTVDV